MVIKCEKCDKIIKGRPNLSIQDDSFLCDCCALLEDITLQGASNSEREEIHRMMCNYPRK